MSDMAKQLDDVHGRASSQAATIKALAAENRRLRSTLEIVGSWCRLNSAYVTKHDVSLLYDRVTEALR